MQIRNLVPSNWRRKGLFRRNPDGDNPLLTLQHDINRVFDDFWSRFEWPFGAPDGAPSAAVPSVDMSETDNAIEVAVELPGMDEKDIDIRLTDDVLTIRGEKKVEREENRKGYYLSERSFGSFYRSIPLPPGVDTGKAEARFRKGVLTVSLPKTPEAQEKVRKIEIKAA